jgi:hypothetical protein
LKKGILYKALENIVYYTAQPLQVQRLVFLLFCNFGEEHPTKAKLGFL